MKRMKRVNGRVCSSLVFCLLGKKKKKTEAGLSMDPLGKPEKWLVCCCIRCSSCSYLPLQIQKQNKTKPKTTNKKQKTNKV